MTDKTLMDAQVGDLVCIAYSGWRESYSQPKPIKKVMATQISAHGLKWRRTTGCQIGENKWSRQRLVLFTPELISRIDQLYAELSARRACIRAAETLEKAARDSGAEATRLAALLPAELRKDAAE